MHALLNPELLTLAAMMLLTGAVGGVIAGMLGVGGGIVIVPVLDLVLAALGVDPSVRMHVTVATSLATIIPTAISSSRAHEAKGAVDHVQLRRWGIAIFLGASRGGRPRLARVGRRAVGGVRHRRAARRDQDAVASRRPAHRRRDAGRRRRPAHPLRNRRRVEHDGDRRRHAQRASDDAVCHPDPPRGRHCRTVRPDDQRARDRRLCHCRLERPPACRRAASATST